MLFLVNRHSSLLVETGMQDTSRAVYACIILYTIPLWKGSLLHTIRHGIGSVGVQISQMDRRSFITHQVVFVQPVLSLQELFLL